MIHDSMIILFILLIQTTIINCNNEVTVCQDNISGIDKARTKLVDVVEGSKVQLLCNFCNQKDNYDSKLWFYKKRGGIDIKELITNKFDGRKLSITLTHMLILKEYNNNMESGIYTCKQYKGKEEDKFTYVLDGVMESNNSTGTVTQWHDYKSSFFDSLNEKLINSKEEPFVTIRDHFQLTFKLVIIWEDSNSLKASSEPSNGRKIGKCRLRPIHYNEHFPVNNYTIYFLYDNYDVSCHSKNLYNLIPELSRIVRNIPDYEIREFRGKDLHTEKKNKNNKKKTSYVHETNRVPENGHFTFVCPQSGQSSYVKWIKDNALLNISFRNDIVENEEEPHITMDTYDSLRILHVTKNEGGIYECFRDGKLIKKWSIEVISKTKLLNQEFIRYSIYLGFVLSLTITCYCAGVCVAWRRRASFADPLHIYVKKNYSNIYAD